MTWMDDNKWSQWNKSIPIGMIDPRFSKNKSKHPSNSSHSPQFPHTILLYHILLSGWLMRHSDENGMVNK